MPNLSYILILVFTNTMTRYAFLGLRPLLASVWRYVKTMPESKILVTGCLY